MNCNYKYMYTDFIPTSTFSWKHNTSWLKVFQGDSLLCLVLLCFSLCRVYVLASCIAYHVVPIQMSHLWLPAWSRRKKKGQTIYFQTNFLFQIVLVHVVICRHMVKYPGSIGDTIERRFWRSRRRTHGKIRLEMFTMFIFSLGGLYCLLE